ncbi:pyridoxal phosphate-dependent aminotransferase [Dethiobacter alkaliphilus]|uniref:pyridoxal phosphate-dependent aminotransferase n=1 Tax=Dethiobacter alkaliphilus TaxID=427926 RepID=UPI002225F081|nr:pyridoxal phosphate-dependent aminotransferase [Dethiobacter alkaliphilus]MCW3488908.1 pyridoxal phosphate-dependent aminotransferase [Dethiobacter alkaliphilus]
MLSKKAQSISPSPTLAIDAKAKKMKADGVDVIGFGAGEPDFDTPEHIKDAAVSAIHDGFTRYTPVAGMLDLQQAICEKLQADNGLTYQPNEIVVSNGAKHSLTNVFAALLNPGDEVIIPAPYWVSYSEIVKLNDGVPVIVPTQAENNFKITPLELAGAVTSKTKAILINSPNNPTGQVYTAKELQAVADFAVARNLYVVSDEIYEKLIYGEHEHVSIASLNEKIKDLTIVINGVSKSYAMTGWRIGYTACRADIAKTMSSIQSHATSNPNSIAQKATIAALTGSQQCVADMKVAFSQRRDYMVDKISATPGLSCIEPTGAFYVFMDVSSLFERSLNGQAVQTSDNFAALLLEQAKVAVVPGTGFGAPNYVRLSYALGMEQIKTGMTRIENFINQLK